MKAELSVRRRADGVSLFLSFLLRKTLMTTEEKEQSRHNKFKKGERQRTRS